MHSFFQIQELKCQMVKFLMKKRNFLKTFRFIFNAKEKGFDPFKGSTFPLKNIDIEIQEPITVLIISDTPPTKGER